MALGERRDALQTFHHVVGMSFVTTAVMREDYRIAARLADQYTTGLRAGDALHLAVASSNGATLVSLDRSLVLAAEALAISAEGL